MQEEKDSCTYKKSSHDLSFLDDAALAERIMKNVYFARNSLYYLGEAFDGDNNNVKSPPLWLFDEAQQKMAEINECLIELLERIKTIKETGGL